MQLFQNITNACVIIISGIDYLRNGAKYDQS